MEGTYEEKFQQASKKESYLMKKSPSFLKGFQKRWFAIQDGGNKLVYYKDKPTTKSKGLPKGIIEIMEITSITHDSKQTFTINFSGRNFVLKAENVIQRELWTYALNFLLEHFKKMDSDSKKVRTTITDKSADGQKSWKASKQDGKVLAKISLENQKTLASYDIQELNLENIITDDKVLELKNIAESIKRLDPDVAAHHIVYGWLKKRSKGKVKYFHNRFIIMASAKPLKKNYHNELLLTQNQLPHWMELETAYYFKVDDDEDVSEALGSIPVKDILDIEVKNMAESQDEGFTFLINIGEKVQHFNADNAVEMYKWLDAIDCSRKTLKEQLHSIQGKITKNIDKIIESYDKFGAQSLYDKIESDFNRVLQDSLEPSADDVLGFLKDNSRLSQEFIDVCNACAAKDPPRGDILKEYTSKFHERLCKRLSSCWEEFHDEIAQPDILPLIKYVSDYNDQISKYGIKDERVANGLVNLSTTFSKRLFKNTISIVFGIVKSEKETEPELNEENLLVTSSPQDLYKIANEAFEQVKICPVKEFSSKIVSVAREFVAIYQRFVLRQVKKKLMVENKLISLCNNTVQFINLTHQFAKSVYEYGQLTESEFEKEFKLSLMLRNFSKLGNLACDLYIFDIIKQVVVLFQESYQDINLENIVRRTFDIFNEVIDKLHINYVRRLWKTCFEQLVLQYFHCMLRSTSKLKSWTLNQLITKINYDKQVLMESFQEMIFPNALKDLIKILDYLVDFLESSPAMLSMTCLEIRKSVGPGFSTKAVKIMLELRSDMESDERKETYANCKEVLNSYQEQEDEKKHNSKEVSSTFFNKFAALNGDEQNMSAASIAEQQSLNIELEEDIDDGVQNISQKQDEVKQDEIEELEGYLEKRHKNGMMFQSRYYLVTKGRICWYKSKSERRAQNTINCDTIKDCVTSNEAQEIFLILLNNSDKVYELKTESKELRDQWIKAIKFNMQKSQEQSNHIHRNVNQNLFQQIKGESLFEDYEDQWTAEDANQEAEKLGISDPLVQEEQENEIGNDNTDMLNADMSALEIQNRDQLMNYTENSNNNSILGCFSSCLASLGFKKRHEDANVYYKQK